MSTRTRIAVTAVSALALGITEYGIRWTAGDPGLARDLWSWGGLVAYVLGIASVFAGNRWWALLPALAPTAADLYLENFTAYVPPSEREELVLPLVLVIVALCIQVALQAGVLAIGFLVRPTWRAGRQLWVNRRGRVPSPRG